MITDATSRAEMRQAGNRPWECAGCTIEDIIDDLDEVIAERDKLKEECGAIKGLHDVAFKNWRGAETEVDALSAKLRRAVEACDALERWSKDGKGGGGGLDGIKWTNDLQFAVIEGRAVLAENADPVKEIEVARTY